MTSNASQSSTPCQTCSLCNVKIDPAGTVHFTYGPPGSRERLYARVCKHVNNQQCINADKSKIGLLIAADHYGFEEVNVGQIERLLASATS